MTPEEMVAAARRLIQRPDVTTSGVWPRAAAFLARQALELAVAALWAATPQATTLSRCSMRSQLLCLAAYLDQDTATRAAYLSAALSHACHYHSYELAPTAAELTSWLDEAAHLITALKAHSMASASEGIGGPATREAASSAESASEARPPIAL
jgi:hypothetical protein